MSTSQFSILKSLDLYENWLQTQFLSSLNQFLSFLSQYSKLKSFSLSGNYENWLQ